METIKGLKRTNYCGELRIEDAGKEVTLFGWCQRQRDLGNLIFIDLRDRTGLVQLSFNDTTDREVFAKAQNMLLPLSALFASVKAKQTRLQRVTLKLTLKNFVSFQRLKHRLLKLQRAKRSATKPHLSTVT